MGKLFITTSFHNNYVELATQRLIPLFFQARYASEYILEIGMYTTEVYAYSARIRCAAVLYLIRALLQNFCNAEGTNILRSITFTQRDIPLWTQAMARVMNFSDEGRIRDVAKIFAFYLKKMQEDNYKILMNEGRHGNFLKVSCTQLSILDVSLLSEFKFSSIFASILIISCIVFKSLSGNSWM